ncbi:MAG: chemotaxis protein CheB [Janthinobacterium lividum]|jgi:two-component system chemotaxis response regulator CheB|uniref:chemotaxis protein CheB n=1 Tax=Pseudomonas TaxID=286 RepID=UPI001CFBCE34|nr:MULTISPECIES: chemotaxis protein CheB [Pseudomonas]
MNRYGAIVVGASAGGVEALLHVFSALPKAFDIPILTVLHLPDERRSQLSEVFATRLGRDVREGSDKVAIEPGVIYFAGPSYHLSVERDFTLSLSQEERVHFSRPAIDLLFDSAADAYGPGLVGVLMTGANEDGAKGLAAIKRQGGLTIVQDPAEARMPTMPLAALKLQQPDHILSLNGIGSLLAKLERSKC